MFSELKLPVILQGRQWFRRWIDSRGAPGGRGWILSSIHYACQSVLEQERGPKRASVCVCDCETPACTLLLRSKVWWQHKVVRIPDVQRFLKFLYWPKLTKVFWTIACLQTVSEHCRNGKKNAVLYCCLLLAAQKNVCSDMQCWRLNLDYVTPATATGVCSARRGHKVFAFCGPFQACEKSNKEQKRVECLLTLYKYKRSKVLWVADSVKTIIQSAINTIRKCI